MVVDAIGGTDQRREVPLGGGVTAGVVRVGDTVRRPHGPQSEAVHALLRHLEAVGFDAAPRFLGTDAGGRTVLSYVPGETPAAPLPGYAATDAVLAGVARLLRRYHDAVASFVPPAGARWACGPSSNLDDAPDIVGHCDVSCDNVVFSGGMPHALIDFDLARPTTRLFDVVTTLRHWAPVADPIDRDAAVRRADVADRVALFCRAYRLPERDRARLLPALRQRLVRSRAAMRERALAEGGAWARAWRAGAGDRLRRATDWLDVAWDELDAALR